MTEIETAANDVQVEERIQPIHVTSEHVRNYQVVSQIRDLTLTLDEPKELGGRNSGPTPLETVLAALNSCSAMIVHVLRREMGFEVRHLRIQTTGYIEVRRVEMKRTGKKYSEVEPLIDHYDRVVQKFYVTTSEPPERLSKLREDVERLCPLQVLFRTAGVPMETEWIAVND